MVYSSMCRCAQQLRQSVKYAANHRNIISSSSVINNLREAPHIVLPRSNANARRLRELVRAPLPQHVKADPTGVVIGMAVLGALIGVGKMWWDVSSSSTEKADSVVYQEILQADIALFFVELIKAIEELIKNLPEIENSVRTELKKNNQELNDADIERVVFSQFYPTMELAEQELINKRQWNRHSFETALEKMGKDAEIVKLQQDLNDLLIKTFPTLKLAEVPEDLTADKTLVILKEVVAGMEKAMSDVLSNARAEGITDATKAMEEFQHLYMEFVEQMTQARMKAHGISQQTFMAALQKYHTENEHFRQQVEKIYDQQAKAYD
ncbi:hypothetical protein PsorP6_004402 [Peronosclerospora sorghi]|uniref:Uncharacterized protein n=1 Tax=Peronosclerospora sorghi TaxID=230839 RepID=A0ACC0VPK5_9STRA|nr:hypothetical protein PsorP6_004402 [Peronosclerospora sorghi]